MQFDEGVLDGACGDAVEFGDLSQVERIHSARWVGWKRWRNAMGGRKQSRENMCRVLQAYWLSCPLLLRQHPPHRRAPQAQVSRNRGLAEALLRQGPNLRGIVGLGTWSAVRLS